MQTNTSLASRLVTIDALRGVAVVLVCIYHFTNGNGQFLPAGNIKLLGSLGVYGVQVFFVISGFILPFAMHRAGYELGQF